MSWNNGLFTPVNLIHPGIASIDNHKQYNISYIYVTQTAVLHDYHDEQ